MTNTSYLHRFLRLWEFWVPGPCFPPIDEKHPGNSVLHSYILFGWTEFHNLFTFYLIQAMSAKKISSSNSVRPSIEAASNWQKPSLNYSSNDTMSNDDLIDVITLRLTRMGELEQENIILKRKLNRYCLFYFLFVTAVKLSYPIKPGCFHQWRPRVELLALARIFATFIFYLYFIVTRKGLGLLLVYYIFFLIFSLVASLPSIEWHKMPDLYTEINFAEKVTHQAPLIL